MRAKTVFRKHNKEFAQFDLVENKLSSRSDMHAFMLLDRLFPHTQNMIAAAEHEIIYLGLDEEQLDTLDELTLRDLVRCGLMIDSDGVCMFV